MRIILTGGGTAGHVYPAVAIAEYIRTREKNAKILFVGREGGDENRAVTDADIELKTLNVMGLARRISIDNIKSLLLALKSVTRAKEIIKDFKPDVILGTGGYVSYPCLRAGVTLGIPIFIHESNVYPGLVTRILSKKCRKVLINMEGTKEKLKYKGNALTVGNPLRMDFKNIPRREARRRLGIKEDELLIVSFGGSGGSEAINDACISLMKSHSQRNPKIKHIHATGKRYYEIYREKNSELCTGKNGCRIKSYIDNMPELLLSADIVICRCGAITLSEIASVGAAAILIPSPNVTDNHQYKNALYLKERSAAELIEEKELTERLLLDTVRELEVNEKKRALMKKNIRQLYTENSAEKIYKTILKEIGRF